MQFIDLNAQQKRIRPQIDAAINQHVAKRYSDLLGQARSEIIIPHVPVDITSVWAQYTLRLDDRHAQQARLSEAGIPSMVYYARPLHLLKALDGRGYKQGAFPIAEHAAETVLSLPFHPYLTLEEQDRVVRCFRPKE